MIQLKSANAEVPPGIRFLGLPIAYVKTILDPNLV